MTVDEYRILYSAFGGFGVGALVAGSIMFFLLRFYLSSYLGEKAKNLATKEDIAAITREVERVRVPYFALVEELKARHQLRLAAVDKRLQAHQEAFVRWLSLVAATHSDQVDAEALKCQEWWGQNCIYLEPKVREGFVQAYRAARDHNSIVRNRSDSKLVIDNWSRITALPDLIFQAVQLPGLSDLEAKELHLQWPKDSP
jgi:hypothetical protein